MDFHSYETILRKSGNTKRERVIKKSMSDTMNYAPDSPAVRLQTKRLSDQCQGMILKLGKLCFGASLTG